MNDWLSYALLAILACAGWLALGYVIRKSYNAVVEGKR